MVDLGAKLTISARGCYATEKQSGSHSRLMGFNELQHHVDGRIRQFGAEWTLESFLDGLLHKADFHGITADVGWAIESAISAMK